MEFWPCKSRRGETLLDILKFLQESPSLCAFIKRLYLIMSVPLGRTVSLAEHALQYEDLVLLSQTLQLFPRLKEMLMQDVVIHLADPGQMELLPTHFLHLDEFTYAASLLSSYDVCMADALCILSWLGDVGKVSIERVRGLNPTCGGLPTIGTKLRVRSLGLSAVANMQGFVRAISSIRFYGLKSLHLNLSGSTGFVDEADVCAFLGEVAPRLEELHCNAEWFMSRESLHMHYSDRDI